MVLEFIEQYFIKPIYTSEGYNIYNTVIYGMLLLAGAYGMAKLLKRLEVKMDEHLFIAAMPFVVLGGLLRALEEFARITGAGLLPVSALFLTPGIYLLVAFLALASLTAAKCFRRANYASSMSAVGWHLAIAASSLLILLVSAVITLIGAFLLKRLQIMHRENLIIFSSFAVETASVTLAVYLLSYTVAQPETRALLSHGTLLYPFFKLSLVLGIIYLVEEVPRKEETHWLSKLLLLVLGLPMGIHNSLQVLMGV